MFKLVKMLSTSNLTEETTRLPRRSDLAASIGSAMVYSNGTLVTAAADQFPDYILTKDNIDGKYTTLCYPVSSDMIFKAEYASSINPKIGMKVGIANHKGVSNCVTFNTTGKAVIVELGKQKNIVYIKFNRN